MTRFAPNHELDGNGLYHFPRDIEWRRELFPAEAMKHPAKMNLFLCQEIVRYVSKPGDTILDPFGGTGSTMIAALEGRSVVLLEIEPNFLEMQEDALHSWPNQESLHVMRLQGDNRQLLPIPCDHTVFSPPYASAMHAGTGMDDKREELEAYASDPLNLGLLNPFLYAQQMDRLYRLLGESVATNGTMTVVIKDQMAKGERIFHSQPCIRSAVKAGFELEEWFKWSPPGSGFQHVMKAKGSKVVEDEDILIFRRMP